jgi:hypothetical protein
MFGFDRRKETQVATDFILTQKLDFITKGLSANGKLSYDNRYWTVGPRATNSGALTKYIKPTPDARIPINVNEAPNSERKVWRWG